MSGSDLRRLFLTGLGFAPDPFQLKAIDALDAGDSVLVAAPTGSGKTVVAEYAVGKALAEGGKAFYTSPLKALSNQKFGDLTRRHGSRSVGLLTGDNTINPDAPVVVMTTEVLRNMIYARSSALQGLRYVVLDEVHYLQNPYRGAVWEEVIIHLAPVVRLVCLSATVSNAEEFAAWIETVRGSTTAVIEEHRPVELRNLYMVGDRSSEVLHILPTLVDGRPNPEAASLDAGPSRPTVGRPRRRHRLHTPRRTEVVEALAEAEMLPAIYFIFSRAACDDAVRQCLNEGMRLTQPEERRRIRAVIEERTAALADEDLRVLGYDQWASALEAGIGAHHAGLVPPFKEAVESCFEQGLVRVVFATETLALGVNMPARTVVIENLSKFSGEHHELLTPGEYTQLTGRAGRRGIDELGHAVVLWSPYVSFETVAALASRRASALTSSFRPTYNMAANLVKSYPPDHARHLLNLSFAQYHTDAEVVRLEAQLARTRASLSEAERMSHCGLGDVEEYRALLAARKTRAGAGPGREEVRLALERLRPGDVLLLPGMSSGGRLAVVATSRRRGGEVKLTGVNAEGRRLSLTARDVSEPPRPVARLPLPSPYDPSANRFLRETAAALRSLDLPPLPTPDGRSRRRRSVETEPGSSHPVARCPERAVHLRAADRVQRLRGDAERLERRIRSRAESLARQLDRVLGVLGDWGYVEDWRLTAKGDRLCRIYHECDLLIAECLARGLFDGLDPPDLAGLASVFTYEARGPEVPGAEAPGRLLAQRVRRILELTEGLNAAERAAGLVLTRAPDPGFASLARDWAAGRPLGEVVGEESLSGGDFVRNVKQLIDLVRQIEAVAEDPATASAARHASMGLFRGVVSASSVVAVRDDASP